MIDFQTYTKDYLINLRKSLPLKKGSCYVERQFAATLTAENRQNKQQLEQLEYLFLSLFCPKRKKKPRRDVCLSCVFVQFSGHGSPRIGPRVRVVLCAPPSKVHERRRQPRRTSVCFRKSNPIKYLCVYRTILGGKPTTRVLSWEMFGKYGNELLFSLHVILRLMRNEIKVVLLPRRKSTFLRRV